jgi:hypothetical protein
MPIPSFCLQMVSNETIAPPLRRILGAALARLGKGPPDLPRVLLVSLDIPVRANEVSNGIT